MTTQRVRTWILRVAGLALFGLLPIAPAHAGFCAIGDTCEFHLLNTNVTGFTIDIEVIVNNLGPNTQITVNYLDDNITNTALGIDKFAFNSLLTVNTFPVSGGWSSASCPTGGPNPGCQMDGFGRFKSEIDDPAGTDLNFSFFLNGIETTFADNANGGEFALHIRYDGNCSGFASDGTATPSPNTACIPDDNRAPEPGTLLLLGLGMAGLGYARSRARRS